MIYLNAELKEPLYQQLYEQLKRKIIDGEYAKGKRLTAIRQLAKLLCVGRNTVEAAYDQLCVEGYVASRQGSGFVVQDIQDGLLDYPYKSKAEKRQHEISRRITEAVPESVLTSDTSAGFRFDFQYGNLPPRNFPRTLWRRLAADALASFEAQNICSYGDKQGERALRHEIVEYLHESRGINCVPEQVVLCNGHQDALAVISMLFADGNRTLAMEDPGYDFTRVVFENHGYGIAPIPVGDCGIRLQELQDSRAKLVYTTPSHQFPMGMVMPIGHRAKLLQWAEQADGVIIEDDYDSELRYYTRPVPALQSIDRHGRVIYLGTFSKALSPALRMGYLVLPQWLLPKYDRIFKRYKPTVPWLQQQIVTLYMAEGHWEKHLRKCCLVNKRKRDVLVQTIQDLMGDKVRIQGENAGLHVLLQFLDGRSQEEMIEKAAQHQIRVYPTRQYWIQQERAIDNLVLLGFSGLLEEEIVEGVTLLHHAWFG